nr:reverse transcriptase [Tanacetum cinerariifolium]
MVQPEGFVNPKHPRQVCKLQISIYGLKQASRSWNKRFDEEIKKKQHSNATRCKTLAWKVFCHERLRSLLMQHSVELSKSQGPSTPAERRKRDCQRYNIYREAAFPRVKTSVRSLNLGIAYPGRFPNEVEICRIELKLGTSFEDEKREWNCVFTNEI